MTIAARPGSTTILAVLAGIAAVTAILGVAVALLFNPLWIGVEQERSGVPETGFSSDQVRAVTHSILADLLVGPPTFEAAVTGSRS